MSTRRSSPELSQAPSLDESSQAVSTSQGSPAESHVGVDDESSQAVNTSQGSPAESHVGVDDKSLVGVSKVIEPEDLLNHLKDHLKHENNTACLWDYFCCMVVRDHHDEFFKREYVKAKPLHIRQGALKDYLNGIAKERLLWAIGFLFVALFCLGAINFMENLDEMFNKTTDCKVDLDVTNSRGSRVQDSFVVARLLTGKCPKPEMDNIILGQNEYLQVKKVKCDIPQTETNGDSVCFNMFRCHKNSVTCRDLLFPSTANTN